MDFRSYVMTLSFILSLQVLFYDFRFYFVFKLVFLTLKTFE
ncbi:putative membrane protein [Helicobacter pylori Hp H-43]|nr:putative membrane protein [Helicobacter pylori Hp H-43]